jgi:uncharacterized membrane protein YbhN (UPF0104 family)
MKGKRIFSLLIRYGLTAVAIGYAVWRIWKDQETFGQSLENLADAQWPLVAISFLLIAANVATETWKWRMLVRPLYPKLTFGKAVKAVLAGMSTGLVTPNRVGEYAGRVLHLGQGKRWEAISLTFVDRLCQMLITLILGYVAIMLRLDLLNGSPVLATVVLAIPILAVGGFLLFSVEIGRWLGKRNLRRAWLSKMAAALLHTKRSRVVRILALSLLRYSIFSTQYILLMLAFTPVNLQLSTCILFVLLVFLGKSVLPVVSGVGELGVRESLALTYATLLGIPDPTALQATFLLFVFNILMPAMVGIPFVQGMRIGKEDE